MMRVVRAHERRTSTEVRLDINDLPEKASLPAKITLYRLIQEGLNNAFRHANGAGQHVLIMSQGEKLRIEISIRV